MKLKTVLVLIITTLVFFSCDNSTRVDVSGIKIDSKLIRFDSLFYTSDSTNLITLKGKYPLMFPKIYSNTVWLNKISDAEEQEVYRKTTETFGDFKKEYDEILSLLKHIKYYFPKFKIPDVYTIISGFDYEYPVLYTGERIFISLDMYLGQEEGENVGFPSYLAVNMRSERIKVDVAIAILKTIIATSPFSKSLLSEMIYNGKIMYLTKKIIPNVKDELIIGYTKEQIEWCENNEFNIWTFLISNKYIYSKDVKLIQRFIDVAPFTKFFLELDRESPGRVGVWLGWQIVNSYMHENNISVDELVRNTNTKEIFSKSGYKPSK